MQQAVNVFEVLDVARQVADQQRMDASKSGNEKLEASKQAQIDAIREARAAVAELIDSSARANRHLVRINGSSGWRDGEQSVLDQLSAALARLSAVSA